MLIKYIVALCVSMVVILLVEVCYRYGGIDHQTVVATNVDQLMNELPKSKISGREIGNQMLVHNVALFSEYKHPDEVSTAYVGTSRTKVLRPDLLGFKGAINGSGNSYNEISFGLLLQAEILRLKFPNLKKVYFESSLLLRRPNRLILEADHKKYLPLLRSLMPLINQLPNGNEISQQVSNIKFDDSNHLAGFHFIEKRSEIRLSNLVNGLNTKRQGFAVLNDVLFTQLKENGERVSIPRISFPKEQQKPEITIDNVKVQRLRSIVAWAPWDGLFDLIALWGREHSIEIVFFQPPVRSDLYYFQVQNGLKIHLDDLQRVANKYQIPFVDLNSPELGFMNDWSLFSDEDHLESCSGVVLLQKAIDSGYQEYLTHKVLFPKISKDSILLKNPGILGKYCGAEQ